MNASLKSNLFLGVLILVISSTLGVVNSLVRPLITQRQIDQQNAAYLDVLNLSSSTGFVLEPVASLSPDLTNQGVVKLLTLTDETSDELVGAAYEITTSGWGGTITFLLGMRDDIYTGLTIVEQHETRGIGDVLLDGLETLVEGVSVTDIDVVQAAISAYILQETLSVTFANVTRSAMVNAIDVARTDYLARRSSNE